jgi:hypothetical protein
LVENYEGTYFEVGQVWLTAQGSEKVKIIQLNEDTTILVEGKIRYSVQLNGKFNKSGLESERDIIKLISTETPTESTPSEPQPKTLSEYLKENNAYESFVENCVERALGHPLSFECKRGEAEDIDDFFIWDKTKEGHDYWENLQSNIPKPIKYDMNEIIFAEVDKRIAEQTLQPEFISTEEFDQIFQENSSTKYMVFVEDKNTPRCIHDCIASAEKEAKRLSAKEIGCNVMVLSVVKTFKSKVIVEEI